MANINEVYSAWLKFEVCEDLKLWKKPLKIMEAEIDEFEQNGSMKRKVVLRFDEIEQGLILNATNANTIGNMFGTETDNWLNKVIYLKPVKRQVGRDKVSAIAILGEDEEDIPELDKLQNKGKLV
jgi:hypothetical protein